MPKSLPNRARAPSVGRRTVGSSGRTITLDFAKGLGTEGDPGLGRKTHSFAFKVAPDGVVFVQDAFAEPPRTYAKPEDIARHIVKLLFGT